MSQLIHIEVAYAGPGRQLIKALKVVAGTTVAAAIEQSSIGLDFPEIDLTVNRVGIFSKHAELTDQLREGDRIEIYRPLLADPKEMRKKRAAQKQAVDKTRREAAKGQRSQF